MKYNQMRAFTETMVAGSVAQAARNLHKTQPAVSALISSLERDLGMDLFQRHKGRLHPLPEAGYLFEECSELLRRIDLIEENMERIKSMQSGELKVISNLGVSAFLLSGILSKHFLRDRGVNCTLVTRAATTVYRMLSAQHYDIGIADYDPVKIQESRLTEIETFAYSCLCCMAHDDELSGKEIITPKDLENRPLATLLEEHPTYASAKQAFRQCGCKLDPQFTAQHFLPLLSYVEHANGYAIVDPLCAESYRLYSKGAPGLVFKPVTPEIGFEVAIIQPAHRPTSLIAGKCCDLLVEELGRISRAYRPA